jgi:hypothetical protein
LSLLVRVSLQVTAEANTKAHIKFYSVLKTIQGTSVEPYKIKPLRRFIFHISARLLGTVLGTLVKVVAATGERDLHLPIW